MWSVQFNISGIGNVFGHSVSTYICFPHIFYIWLEHLSKFALAFVTCDKYLPRVLYANCQKKSWQFCTCREGAEREKELIKFKAFKKFKWENSFELSPSETAHRPVSICGGFVEIICFIRSMFVAFSDKTVLVINI